MTSRHSIYPLVALLLFGATSTARALPNGLVSQWEAAGNALAAPADAIHELGEPGPYLAGFQHFVVFDVSRPAAQFGVRPVPIYVFYPVDPGTITVASPEAVYPLDPLYGFLPSTQSGDWERYGLDRAYQAPQASEGAPFPLVMFSPGWGTPAWGHLSIGARLASHGFVVAIVRHFADGVLPWEPFDHPAVASFHRPRDVSFALDQLLEWNDTPGHLLGGTVHPDQIAASGWSLGGYAAMTLVAGDDSVCDTFADEVPPPPAETCEPSRPDPRIGAIVPLDGSNQILHFYELARVDTPTMGIGQEWGTLSQDGDPSWQARQHAAFSGRPAYRVDVADTIHRSFSDNCVLTQVLGDYGIYPPEQVEFILATQCAPFLPHSEVTSLVTKYMTAFLKTELVGEAGYQRLLTPGRALTEELAIELFVTERRSPHAIDDDMPDHYIYFPHQPGSEQARGAADPAERRAIPHLGLPR